MSLVAGMSLPGVVYKGNKVIEVYSIGLSKWQKYLDYLQYMLKPAPKDIYTLSLSVTVVYIDSVSSAPGC